MTGILDRAAAWVHRPLTDDQRQLLGRFGAWLEGEAVPAGGIGAADRIETRHLADSLTFAAGWPESDPSEMIDLGSGVGLPGIPLAILFPATRVVLVDRSGRRARLARRAIRVLGLANVEVMERDLTSVDMSVPAVVSRAAVPVGELRPHVLRLLQVGGTGVLGASRTRRPPSGGDRIVEIPPTVLDHRAWLRIITRQ